MKKITLLVLTMVLGLMFSPMTMASQDLAGYHSVVSVGAVIAEMPAEAAKVAVAPDFVAAIHNLSAPTIHITPGHAYLSAFHNYMQGDDRKNTVMPHAGVMAA